MSDLDEFEKKLEPHKKAKAEREKKESESKRGMQVGIELVAPMIVCMYIGKQVDDYFGTLPLWFLILTVLGMITGFYNVYRYDKNNREEINDFGLPDSEKNAKTTPTSREEE